jgi:hypothetical protein
LPAITERLNTLHQGLARDVTEWGVKTKEQLDSIDARLEDLFEGRVSMTLNSTPPAVRPTAATTDTATGTTTGTMATSTTAPTAATLTATAPAVTIAPTPVSTPSFHFVRTSPFPTEAALPPAEHSPRPLSSSAVHDDAVSPPYLLSRMIFTVSQLWREWTVGVGGGPSVQGLEELYGTFWRQKHSETVMYGRRKIIIDEIRRRQAEGINVGAAVKEVELMRQRGQLSLYQLYQLLNRQRQK